MHLDSMMELYVDELQDMYSAEKQLTKALPKIAKAVKHAELADAIQNHLRETQDQLARVEQIIRDLGRKPGGETCEAMKGLITESDEIAGAKGDNSVRDAGLIVAAQKVEHYEIASYGSLCTFAKLLGRKEDLKLLKQTLQEEKTADATLTELAEGIVNAEAAAS